MAKLPSNFENNNQLKNMKVGDSGYIVPWGMWVDMDGNAWLNENYDFDPVPGGTVQLKVTRVVDGYIAHIHDMNDDYKWARQNSPSYMSPKEVCYGPVVGYKLDYKTTMESIIGKGKSLFKWILN